MRGVGVAWMVGLVARLKLSLPHEVGDDRDDLDEALLDGAGVLGREDREHLCGGQEGRLGGGRK